MKRLHALLLTAALGLSLSAAAEPSRERRHELLHLLRHDCGSCHGMSLKGGLGPPLLPQSLAGKPPLALQVTILMGRPGTPMPPWRGFISEQEAEWLVGVLQEGVPERQ